MLMGVMLTGLMGACTHYGWPLSARARSARILSRALALLAALVTVPAMADEALDDSLRALIKKHNLSGKAAFSESHPALKDPSVLLGRELFFSKVLSGDNDAACASCHHPFMAGGDALSLAVGVAANEPDRLGLGRTFDWQSRGAKDPHAAAGPNVPRNSPTIINVGLYQKTVFHDGRLEQRRFGSIRSPESVRDQGRDLMAVQARLPVVAEDEMQGYRLLRFATPDRVRDTLVERLREDWPERFAHAFGDAKAGPESVTYERIELALSDYQRSFVLIDNPWFNYVAGDREAIGVSAKRGARDFLSSKSEGGLGCAACHQGDFFTDEKFHAAGFPQIGRGIKRPAAGYGNETQRDGTDGGRWEVTRRSRDRYAFRTPSLLNVTTTAPYAHAGTHATLEDLIAYHLDPPTGAAAFDFSLQHLPQFKNRTINYPKARAETAAAVAAWRTTGITPQALSPERMRDLVAFLQTLTDPCITSRPCMEPWMPDAGAVVEGRLDAIIDPQQLVAR
tara:strand:- start:6406 stop:7929 length:1524 start_codon:yes stop_codon:yes gene_type:complete